jgi:hypothetical protein
VIVGSIVAVQFRAQDISPIANAELRFETEPRTVLRTWINTQPPYVYNWKVPSKLLNWYSLNASANDSIGNSPGTAQIWVYIAPCQHYC